MSPDGSELSGHLALRSVRALDGAIDDLARDLDPPGHPAPPASRPWSTSPDGSDTPDGPDVSEVGELMVIATRLLAMPVSTWEELAPVFEGDQPAPVFEGDDPGTPPRSVRPRLLSRLFCEKVEGPPPDRRGAGQLVPTGARRSPLPPPLPLPLPLPLPPADHPSTRPVTTSGASPDGASN
jgi:hypothetical protein